MDHWGRFWNGNFIGLKKETYQLSGGDYRFLFFMSSIWQSSQWPICPPMDASFLLLLICMPFFYLYPGPLIWLISSQGQRLIFHLWAPMAYYGTKQHSDLIGIAEAWIGALAFEVVVFLLTLYKALTAKIYGSSILYLIIRDGRQFALWYLSRWTLVSPFRNSVFWGCSPDHHLCHSVILCTSQVGA